MRISNTLEKDTLPDTHPKKKQTQKDTMTIIQLVMYAPNSTINTVMYQYSSFVVSCSLRQYICSSVSRPGVQTPVLGCCDPTQFDRSPSLSHSVNLTINRRVESGVIRTAKSLTYAGHPWFRHCEQKLQQLGNKVLACTSGTWQDPFSVAALPLLCVNSLMTQSIYLTPLSLCELD